MNSLVSVVMPVWNPNPAWLRESVASVLGQRGCELELIAVDDGSERPVAELLRDIDDPRLRTVRIEHGGQSAANNAGIAAARGDYLRFVDSDDVAMPASTARLLELSGGRPDVIAYGATEYCDEALRPVWTLTCALEGDVLHDCVAGRFSVRTPGLLFPRRVVESAGPWDTSLPACKDWDFVLRTLEHATVRGSREVATRYRKHGTAITSDTTVIERSLRAVLARFFARRPELAGTRLERRAYAQVAVTCARMHRGEVRAYARRLARAVRLDPGLAAAEVADYWRARGRRPNPIETARTNLNSENPPSTSTRRRR